MELRKLVACTVCAVTTAFAAAGCADGTGQALIPTLPSVDATVANADGTRLKASAPQPLSPRSDIHVDELTPRLVLQNSTVETSEPALSYVFEVFEVAGSAETLVARSSPVAAGNTQTVWTVPANTLKLNRSYAWRAYATFEGVTGSLSDRVSFRTPSPPPFGPVACGSASGPAIIACVANRYPEYLVPTAVGSGSLARRHHNMEFIRDRIIETGICKGVDLGRNFKRGGPVISHDFIVLRQPGQRDRGVDIASGFDDVDRPLSLSWYLFPGPDFGFPFYAKYPPVDCRWVDFQ